LIPLSIDVFPVQRRRRGGVVVDRSVSLTTNSIEPGYPHALASFSPELAAL
jgi:hypothetical protein